MKTFLLLLVLDFFLSGTAHAQNSTIWMVHERINKNGTEIISMQKTDRNQPPKQAITRNLPFYLFEGNDGDNRSVQYRERWIQQDRLTIQEKTWAKKYLSWTKTQENSIPDTEVRTLVSQGSVDNRINLTMAGDGYTIEEKEKFFQDAKRLSDDLFAADAFHSYLPLFNVHAVFVPSQDSGISDVKEKNTALGLYRSPQGSKRAIMPGNTAFIEKVLNMAPATDYPILIANDDFYGGLGGRYAITTRSVRSGPIVLRHELGHNFGNVGEEYDGGQVYSGANSAHDPRAGWPEWITDDGRKFDARQLSGQYVWLNLGEKDFSSSFEFPAAKPNGQFIPEIVISTVGWETADDVSVYLDGQKMAIEGEYTEDRSFFKVKLQQTLKPGTHGLRIAENKKDGNNVVAFALAYAYEADYDFSHQTVAGYPTYNNWGQHSGYRPTHDSCLMKDMLSNHFCVVDQENMWIRFLKRINLVDDVKTKDLGMGEFEVRLETVRLPLEIWWYRLVGGQEQELTAFHNQWIWKGRNPGDFRVRAFFKTAEVRQKTNDLEDIHDFKVK